MKRISGILMAAAIVAFIAAGCGGSSSSNNGGTTPPATSSTTMTAMANASQWMSDTTVLIQSALNGTTTSVKTVSGNNIQCTGTYGGFDCTIWDDLGSSSSADHKCDVTGTYNTTLYSFDLDYDCYTFEPATNVSVDGNWTASISFNNTNTATSASKDAGTAKATSDSCDVEEISNVCGQTYTFDGGSCTATCDGTSSCTSSNALVVIEWTVGSRGITMIDECGTYVIASGTSATMLFCMPSNYQFIMSSTMNGTINGTSVDQNIDIDCTYTY